MTARGTDPHAIDGKFPKPQDHFDLVVVGAGRSGTAASIEAVHAGGKVLLVDENPLQGAQVGNDVPWFFGGRATAA
ncbi:MAG: FAD-dependent oxidoreductase, partial [Novosphingobium sp.]